MTDPWDLNEWQRRQFREAHAAAQAAAANEAAAEPRYPATPAKVAKDLQVLGYLVASRDGGLGWRAYWASGTGEQGVRVELPGTPANAAGREGLRDGDLDRLARQLRELGWQAEAAPGAVLVTATTTPPDYLPSDLGTNSDDPETAWTRPFRRRAAE